MQNGEHLNFIVFFRSAGANVWTFFDPANFFDVFFRKITLFYLPFLS